MTEEEATKRVLAIIDTYWSDTNYSDADVIRDLRANPVVLVALLGVERELSAWKKATAALVEHNDYLRTTFRGYHNPTSDVVREAGKQNYLLWCVVQRTKLALLEVLDELGCLE